VKRALILKRVSTDGQQDNYSPESQEEGCREYADSMGMEVAQVLMEACSGAYEFDQRPIFTEALDAIRARAVDALIVHRVNRATRAGGIHALMLAHECERNEVELHFVDGAVKGRVDITNTASKIMLLIAGDQAYEERKSLLEAMARGRRTRVANYGRPLPGRIAKYGYTRVDERDPISGRMIAKARVEVCEPEAVVVRRIYDLAAKGMSTRDIAALLVNEGVPNTEGEPSWSHGTIRKILRDARYGGGTVYAYATKMVKVGGKKKQVATSEKERIALPEGTFPVIVDPAIWHAVQARLDENARHAVRHNAHPERSLLRGVVYCADCNRAMNVKNLTNGKAFYRRWRHEKWGDDACNHPVIMCHILDGAVWGLILKILKDPDVLIGELERQQETGDGGLKADLTAYQSTLDSIKQREKALIRLASSLSDTEQLDEIQSQLAQLGKQRQAAQVAVNQAERRLASQQRVGNNLIAMTHYFQALSTRLDEIGWEDKRKVMLAFVERVLVWPAESPKRWHVDLKIPEFLAPAEQGTLDIVNPSARR
jgi:site-specific DNA recombinase